MTFIIVWSEHGEHGDGIVMTRGCRSAKGAREITFRNGRMNACGYSEKLGDEMSLGLQKLG